MGILAMRELLPDRRRSWTQKVRIAGQTCYLTVGEYEDGRPGEVFIDVSKEGTFLRGVMGTLARMISMSLQCGAGLDLVVRSLRGLDYPPAGAVTGSDYVRECYSVTDWIAQELAARYGLRAEVPDVSNGTALAHNDEDGIGAGVGEGDRLDEGDERHGHIDAA